MKRAHWSARRPPPGYRYFVRSGRWRGNWKAILSQARNVKLDGSFHQPLDLGQRSSNNADARQVWHVSAHRRGASLNNDQVIHGSILNAPAAVVRIKHPFLDVYFVRFLR